MSVIIPAVLQLAEGDMGSIPEAVNLMVHMDQVTVRQAQKHKAEANRLQRHCQ